MPQQILKTFCGLLILASFLSNSAAIAQTAYVLPEGIYRARIVHARTPALRQRFNQQGRFENYDQALNRSLTTSDFIQQEPRLKKLVGALNKLNPGLGHQLLNANLYGDVSIQVQKWVPALEYGWTDSLSLGIRIPVIKKRIEADFSATSTNNAAAIKRQLGSLANKQIRKGLSRLSQRQFNTQTFAREIFKSKGYNVPSNFTETQIGDIQAGGKYQFMDGPQTLVSLQFGLTLPTGEPPPLDRIYDPGSGDGSWALGGIFIEEHRVLPWLTLHASQKLKYDFPDRRPRAVPKNKDDTLPSLKPEDNQVHHVRRVQSPLVELKAGTTFSNFEKSFEAWNTLVYGHRNEARFYGPGSLAYGVLRDKTGFTKWQTEVGLSYSTIPLYRKGDFKLPMEVKARYRHTMNGRNTVQEKYARLDWTLFFR